MTKFLTIENLKKKYVQGKINLTVFENLSCALQKKESVALMGVSGSGKSTLLHLLGLLDQPSGGHIAYEGQDYKKLGASARDYFRRTKIGFIYQKHCLMADLTALENCTMPLLIQGQNLVRAQEQGKLLLEKVGLKKRMDHFPSQLSGGEQQRVAIARALIHRPGLVLADEPTGSLDAENAEKCIALLLDLVQEFAATLLVATHDEKVAQKMDRVMRLENGEIQLGCM